MRILAISGSLRAASSNTAVVRAAKRVAPENVEVVIYDGLAGLPHFNPDFDNEEVAPSVADFRWQMKRADGVLVSSPEYAHGVPGTLKNALDWLVSSGETVGKPFALVNTSPRAVHAQASLKEILETMAAVIASEASVALPLGDKKDEASIAADPDLSAQLRSAILELAHRHSSD